MLEKLLERFPAFDDARKNLIATYFALDKRQEIERTVAYFEAVENKRFYSVYVAGIREQPADNDSRGPAVER